MVNLLAPSVDSPVEGFTFIDVIAIVILLLAIIRGITVGFKKKGLGLTGFCIVVAGTFFLTPIAFNWIVGSIGKGLYESLQKFWATIVIPGSEGEFAYYTIAVIVGIAVFFVMVILTYILGGICRKINVKYGFTAFVDRLLGAILYAVIFFVLIVIVLWIIHLIKIPKIDDVLAQSFIINLTSFLGPIFEGLMNPLAAMGL